MSEQLLTLCLAAGSGAITGMRSMTMPAFLSRRLSGKRRAGVVSRSLAQPAIANLLSVLAAGEMIGDKTPMVPDRTAPVSLGGRALLAGICGAAIAEERGHSRLGCALISSLTAVAATFLSYELRREAGRHTQLPDPVLGLVEDVLVLQSAATLVGASEV